MNDERTASGDPGDALIRVADELRAADGQLRAMATDPTDEPAFGVLAAGGSRAEDAPAEYAFAIEAIREGYLLHYGTPRAAVTDDADLALLAGDFLYALGLSRLAMLGDTEAVTALAELISDCAAIHAAEPHSQAAAERADERWRDAVARIGRR